MHRSGVVLVMFDLPNGNKIEQRNYREFRKYLISNGYCFVQESIYVKLLRSMKSLDGEITGLKQTLNGQGKVAVLPLTLSNFKSMYFLSGDKFDFSTFSDEIVYF